MRRTIDQPITFDKDSPFAKAMKEPQLMLHRHDYNLSATMRKFKIASKQYKDEQKSKRHRKINEED